MLLEPGKPGSLNTLRAWLKPGFNFLVAICQRTLVMLVMLVEPPQLSCTPYIGAGKLILSQRWRSGETKDFNFQNSIGISTVALNEGVFHIRSY